MSDEPKIRVEGEGLTHAGAAWLERRAGIIGLGTHPCQRHALEERAKDCLATPSQAEYLSIPLGVNPPAVELIPEEEEANRAAAMAALWEGQQRLSLREANE